MTLHLSWDTLNDLLGGRLSTADADASRAHLNECAGCREQWEALRDLVAEAGELPESVTPPADAWRQIATAIDARKRVPFPGASRGDRGVLVTRAGLVAAAVFLVVVSSGTTALLLRGPRAGSSVATATSPSTSAPATATLPSGAPVVVSPATATEVASVEREFVDTANQLRATLEAERSRLAPETVATVERSLRVIDEAISEARQALLQDPANVALRDVLRNNHRQKIDFLRRATALVERA